MRDKLIDMLWKLNDHVYPDYDAKADEILSLFNVSKSVCECEEPCITTKALKCIGCGNLTDK